MRKTSSGFTIVELLIVIVVIGILAAITIVAYNGVQSRAEQSANHAAIRSYIQALRLMKADLGNLPAENSCLGPGGFYTAGTCAAAGQNGTVNTTTNNQLTGYGLSSQPAVKKGGQQTTVVYAPSFFNEPALLWLVPYDQDCVGWSGRFRIDPNWVDSRVFGIRDTVTGTRCYMSLRDL